MPSRERFHPFPLADFISIRSGSLATPTLLKASNIYPRLIRPVAMAKGLPIISYVGASNLICLQGQARETRMWFAELFLVERPREVTVRFAPFWTVVA